VLALNELIVEVVEDQEGTCTPSLTDNVGSKPYSWVFYQRTATAHLPTTRYHHLKFQKYLVHLMTALIMFRLFHRVFLRICPIYRNTSMLTQHAMFVSFLFGTGIMADPE